MLFQANLHMKTRAPMTLNRLDLAASCIPLKLIFIIYVVVKSNHDAHTEFCSGLW